MATDIIGVPHRGAGQISVTSTGGSSWVQLPQAYRHFGMQLYPTTSCTGYAVTLQGSLTTSSTETFDILSATDTTLTASTIASRDRPPISIVRAYSSVLSSGSVTAYISAMH